MIFRIGVLVCMLCVSTLMTANKAHGEVVTGLVAGTVAGSMTADAIKAIKNASGVSTMLVLYDNQSTIELLKYPALIKTVHGLVVDGLDARGAISRWDRSSTDMKYTILKIFLAPYNSKISDDFNLWVVYTTETIARPTTPGSGK